MEKKQLLFFYYQLIVSVFLWHVVNTIFFINFETLLQHTSIKIFTVKIKAQIYFNLLLINRTKLRWWDGGICYIRTAFWIRQDGHITRYREAKATVQDLLLHVYVVHPGTNNAAILSRHRKDLDSPQWDETEQNSQKGGIKKTQNHWNTGKHKTESNYYDPVNVWHSNAQPITRERLLVLDRW
jgi:hypothetical protein